MKKDDFLLELEDLLQREEPCKISDSLEDYEEWDSLSKMAVMAFYSKTFKITIDLETLFKVKTVNDLIHLAGDNISD